MNLKLLTEQAEFVFEKIDNGIYKVNKDKYGDFYEIPYIGVNDVLKTLNRSDVLIVNNSENTIFFNFEIKD